MRNAEVCKDALVEYRAVAGRSDLLQLSIGGHVDEQSVGPWIPVQWNIVDQVSAQTMLWHPTNVQQIHRTEMTVQAIMDHLHLGIAHVRRCSAHCVDRALQCLQTHQDDVLLRHDSRVPSSQTLGAAALAERLLR